MKAIKVAITPVTNNANNTSDVKIPEKSIEGPSKSIEHIKENKKSKQHMFLFEV